MAFTKKNGTLLHRSSKHKHQRCKKTYPKFRLGLKGKNFVNQISYKVGETFVKKTILDVVYYPVPSYKSKKFLVKNTVVKTETFDLVRITSLNSGRLIGILSSLS